MICDKIKELRKRSKLTQTQLSQKLGLTRASINAWEMGISIPSTQYIIELARLFSVSSDYILDLSEESYISTRGLTSTQLEVLHKLLDYFYQENQQES